MDLSRFHRAINLIAVDYVNRAVDANFTKLSSNLASLVGNPGNLQISQAFKDHLEIFRQSLAESELNSADGELLETLTNQGLKKFVGDALFKQIKVVLDQNQLTPNLAAAEIVKLHSETSQKMALVSSIDDAFSALEVDYWRLPDGETEMLLNLPIATETKTLEDLAKEAKDWHQICRSIAETFDAEQNRITIRTVASGSILLYLAAAPAFIFGIAKCLKGVNQILAEVIKLKALYAQLVDSKLPDSLLKEFDNHHAGKASTDLEKLASSLVEEYYLGGDDGRKNELKNSLSMSLKRLSQKLATGTTVTLRLAKPPKPKIEDGAEPSNEQVTVLKEIESLEKIQIEVDACTASLDYKEHSQELIAALPAPAHEDPEK